VPVLLKVEGPAEPQIERMKVVCEGFIAKFGEKPLRPLEIRKCRIRSGSKAK
jgi:hypothetical protein